MFEEFEDISKHASDAVGGEYRRREDAPDYKDFFKKAFDVLEPGTELQWNWHIEYLCNQLQEEVERIAKGLPAKGDMIINIQPRSLKSYICTILLNPWAWTKYPSLKFITVSYADPLAVEHSGKSRKLIKSDWYQKNFGEAFNLDSSQDAKGYFRNNKGGERKATSVGGQIKGSGGNIITIDDPVKPPAENEVNINLNEILTANNWHDSTFYDRVNDPQVDLRLYVMQRLHNRDLTGFLLSKENQEHNHICIPSEVKKKNLPADTNIKPATLASRYKTSRTSKHLKLFFRDRFSKSVLKDYEDVMGDNYSGQIKQKPSEKGGDEWKERYFIRISPEDIPERANKELTGWDLATSEREKKKNSASAYVTGFRWQGAVYVTGCGWFFKKFPEMVSRIKKGTPPHFIENKSSGRDAVPQLKSDGIDARSHDNENRDKFEMASFGAYQAKRTEIYISGSIYHKLLKSRKQGICQFPTAMWDDLHDAFCIFLENITEGMTSREDLENMLDANKNATEPNSPSIGTSKRQSSFRGHSI